MSSKLPNIQKIIEDKPHPSEWLTELYDNLYHLCGSSDAIKGLGFRLENHPKGPINFQSGRTKQLIYTFRHANTPMACPFPRCKGKPHMIDASYAAGRTYNPLGGQFDDDWNEYKQTEDKFACPECKEPLKYAVPLMGNCFWEWAGEEGGEA